jgi:hypothetical protein
MHKDTGGSRVAKGIQGGNLLRIETTRGLAQVESTCLASERP